MTKLPTVFSGYIRENRLTHHHNIRQRDYFHTYIVKSEVGKRAIKYKGSKLWNNLPAEIKNIQSTQSFKYKLKTYLLHMFV